MEKRAIAIGNDDEDPSTFQDDQISALLQRVENHFKNPNKHDDVFWSLFSNLTKDTSSQVEEEQKEPTINE